MNRIHRSALDSIRSRPSRGCSPADLSRSRPAVSLVRLRKPAGVESANSTGRSQTEVPTARSAKIRAAIDTNAPPVFTTGDVFPVVCLDERHFPELPGSGPGPIAVPGSSMRRLIDGGAVADSIGPDPTRRVAFVTRRKRPRASGPSSPSRRPEPTSMKPSARLLPPATGRTGARAARRACGVTLFH